MTKVAFITGITGQDGSYLAELLLSKGYVVYGMLRRTSLFNTGRIEHILSKITLKYGDVLDNSSVLNILNDIKMNYPNMERLEIYHLAAQSHVMVSFETPVYTGQCDAIGTLNILEAVRLSNLIDKVRFYNATTSELFGKVIETPQTETTPFYPRSPYGVAKLYSFWITKNYREAYNIYGVNGILFNHTSPRRGENFVEKKITTEVARIVKGKTKCLTLGNLNSKRDIGHASDYVYGMWTMLQQDTPDDFILSTGSTYSIRYIVETAFKIVGIPIEWVGEGVMEQGINSNTGEILVKIDLKYFRPTEVDLLLGDSSKIRNQTSWKTTKTIDEILKEMVEYDLEHV